MLNTNVSSTKNRIKSKLNNKMEITLNALIRILNKAYPTSQIVMRPTLCTENALYVTIPHGQEGEGRCLYYFNNCKARGMDLHWMKILEDNFHESIKRSIDDGIEKSTQNEFDMDQAHQDAWLNYLQCQEHEKDEEESEKDITIYDLDRANDDGWPISDSILEELDYPSLKNLTV